MNSILDTLLSSPILLIVIGSILLTTILLGLRKIFFGKGKVSSFKCISIDEAVPFICLVEECIIPEGDYGDEVNYYRLFVLNAEIGELNSREIFHESFKICDQKHSVLFFKNKKDYLLRELNDGKVNTFNSSTLPVMFPQLSSGIDSYEYLNQNKSIEVLTKSGQRYWIKPFEKKLFDREPAPQVKSFIDADAVIVKETPTGTKVLVRLAKEKEKDRIKKLMSNSYSFLNDQLSFLDGSCLHVYEKNNCFIILHYEDTDHKNFILSCISFEAKLCWELKQKDLEIRDQCTLDTSAPYKDWLIITVGGFVLSISMEKGNIVWKKRL